MNGRTPSGLLLLLASLLLATGCGSSRVHLELAPDMPSLESMEPAAPPTRVLEVSDRRGARAADHLGEARTGMFNRHATVHAAEPVAELVHDAVQRVLGPAPDSSTDEPAPIAVTVSVDTLTVWENHGLFGEAARARVSLRYHLLEKEGRTLSVRARADVERSGLDATSVLDDALADALAACTKDFTEALLRPHADDLVRVGPDTRLDVLRSLAADAAPDEGTSTGSTSPPDARSGDRPAGAREITAASSEPGPLPHRDEIAATALVAGEDISGGGQLVFQRMFQPREGATEYGFGLGARYLALEDTDRFVDASMFGIAAPLWLRAFRDAERRGPYVGAALNLVTGSEAIEGVDDVNYFFGVMPEMTLGLRLGEAALEAGGFWIGLAGSDLLDSDRGLRLGLNVRIGGDAPS
ncbi:MAG TPA: hypothetical protein VKA86_05170 [Candidatus Krumholzibacteria bacterium]|nr:hypothetical protein [Candidatus Krumholzibacteria bacterium]